MRIGIFVYNFEHKKTQEGLLQLFLNGYKPTCIMAANPVKLNFYQSKIRIGFKDMKYIHPRDIAKKLKIPYHVVAHNEQECIDLVKEYKLDLGIILGARILKQPLIDSFNIGILNMHPGLLPQNRGLDNIKWAVLDNIRQGVTTHLIDSAIDRGFLIDKKSIEVYKDDTLIDLTFRVQNLELSMMIEAIEKIKKNDVSKKRISIGKRNKSVPESIETYLMDIFEDYKKNYRVKLRNDL